LRDLKGMTGGGRWLFPGTAGRKGRIVKTITTNALESALHAMEYRDLHVPHGFRSSASTLLNAERITIEGHLMPRLRKTPSSFSLNTSIKKPPQSTIAISCYPSGPR
jgi:hypothetical protein